jgi:DNA (cytosine-5)-methyltransferase 1
VIAVDMFAGVGGWTEAAESLGLQVVVAANHNPVAVAAHQANHPRVRHVQQDLQQADFRQWPRHDVLLSSPACQGHSQAATNGGGPRRGTAPKHDADRSTAWAVVTCAEVHRPPVVLVENVPEMRSWVLYGAWAGAFADLGYCRHELLLDAANYGVPQERRRLFVVFTLDARPDLGPPPVQPRIPARAIVDLRRRAGWKPVRLAAPGVRSRCATGRANFPAGPFVTHSVTAHPGRSLDRPLGTVTTVPGHWGLVRASSGGDEYRLLTIDELRAAMGFRPGYWLPPTQKDATRLLGNAVPPPLGAAVLRHVLGEVA